MIYIVTWDLNNEKSNYGAARARFIARLERFEHIKDPGLDSVWFVSTAWAVNQISDDLQQALDSNDRLFVSKLRTGEHQGWLSKTVWDWINPRL